MMTSNAWDLHAAQILTGAVAEVLLHEHSRRVSGVASGRWPAVPGAALEDPALGAALETLRTWLAGLPGTCPTCVGVGRPRVVDEITGIEQMCWSCPTCDGYGRIP